MDANKLIELLVDDPRATVTDLADILLHIKIWFQHQERL